jgi:hypothetical protein
MLSERQIAIHYIIIDIVNKDLSSIHIEIPGRPDGNVMEAVTLIPERPAVPTRSPWGLTKELLLGPAFVPEGVTRTVWEKAWKWVFVWFVLCMGFFVLVLAVSPEKNPSVIGFALFFGILMFGLEWKFRHMVRPFFERLGLANLKGFLLLAVGISAIEEVICWAFGNKVANPILWKDIVFCAGVWLPWFACWYLFLSKRWVFREKEALLVAASTGIMYEYIGNAAMWANPVQILIAVPLAVVVYAAIFVLPMQLIVFKDGATPGNGKVEEGTDQKKGSRAKYLVAPVLPYFLSWPVAILIMILFTVV